MSRTCWTEPVALITCSARHEIANVISVRKTASSTLRTFNYERINILNNII